MSMCIVCECWCVWWCGCAGGHSVPAEANVGCSFRPPDSMKQFLFTRSKKY
jgi:hypothetical protein